MLEQYKKAFLSLQQRSFQEAQTLFSEIVAKESEDQTALEFQSLLSKGADAFAYTVSIAGQVVVLFQENQLAQSKLKRIVHQAENTIAYLGRFSGLRNVEMCVLVIDADIPHSYADYKKRPFVCKIRMNPGIHVGNVSHELAHLAFIHPNRFLTEGFAMYVESFGETIREIVPSNADWENLKQRHNSHYSFQYLLDGMYPEMIRIETLLLEHEERLFYFGKECKEGYKKFLAYHQAGSFVHFLIRKYGWAKFYEFSQNLEHCFKPEEILQTTERVLQSPVSRIEHEWLEECFPSQVAGHQVAGKIHAEATSPEKKGEFTMKKVMESLQSSLVPLDKPYPETWLASDDNIPIADAQNAVISELEPLLSELEVSLDLKLLSEFAQRVAGYLHANSNHKIKNILTYYLSRTYLPLLNALDLELDWFFQDMSEMTKTAGFAEVRAEALKIVEKAIGLAETVVQSSERPKTSKDVHDVHNENAGKAEISPCDHRPEYASEFHRVLGELYGKAIKYKGKLSGMTYGPKCDKELKAAYKLDPKNPRALNALGRLKLFMPKFFGGGPGQAKKYFQDAMQLNPIFNESYIGLSLCAHAENKKSECEEYLGKALEISLRDRFAQRLLLKLKNAL